MATQAGRQQQALESRLTTQCWATASPLVQWGNQGFWKCQDSIGTGGSTGNQVQTDSGKRGIPRLAELEWAYKRARPGQNPCSKVLSEESAYPEIQKTQVHLGSAPHPHPGPLGLTEQSVSFVLSSPVLPVHPLQYLTLSSRCSLEIVYVLALQTGLKG